MPQAGQWVSAETLSRYSATALFLQRARAVHPALQPTDEQAGAIVEVCRRLDGLPLAIELAAAQVKYHSPQALLGQLARRLDVLTGGARDLPARQQTMRDTIAWSYQLLDAEEQSLFRALAVFSGGCTREAVEAVWTRSNGVTRPVLLVLVGQLC